MTGKTEVCDPQHEAPGAPGGNFCTFLIIPGFFHIITHVFSNILSYAEKKVYTRKKRTPHDLLACRVASFFFSNSNLKFLLVTAYA